MEDRLLRLRGERDGREDLEQLERERRDREDSSTRERDRVLLNSQIEEVKRQYKLQIEEMRRQFDLDRGVPASSRGNRLGQALALQQCRSSHTFESELKPLIMFSISFYETYLRQILQFQLRSKHFSSCLQFNC